MLRKEQDNPRRRWLGITICILLGLAIGAWHSRQAARGQNDFVTNTVRTITTPFVNAANVVGRWTGKQFGWIFQGRSLAAEVTRLKEENARLLEENTRLREADITAQRLREQLGFPDTPPADKLAADVLSRRTQPSFDTLVIGRGSRDGVKVNSVVVAPAGVLGHVYEVGLTSSVVLLLTDPAAAAGAMIQRAGSRAVGVCKGNGTGRLSLLYLNRDADVKPGDVVITSGMGQEKGIYPKGLPLGLVEEVAPSAAGSTLRVTVKPAVNVDRLEEVYVLR